MKEMLVDVLTSQLDRPFAQVGTVTEVGKMKIVVLSIVRQGATYSQVLCEVAEA